jgi:hypothetical protein
MSEPRREPEIYDAILRLLPRLSENDLRAVLVYVGTLIRKHHGERLIFPALEVSGK